MNKNQTPQPTTKHDELAIEVVATMHKIAAQCRYSNLEDAHYLIALIEQSIRRDERQRCVEAVRDERNQTYGSRAAAIKAIKELEHE